MFLGGFLFSFWEWTDHGGDAICGWLLKRVLKGVVKKKTG